MDSLTIGPVFNEAKVKVLTIAQAISFFDASAEDRTLASGTLDDGCYARAHEMCRRAEACGLSPKKAWAFEDRDAEDGCLKVDHPSGKKAPMFHGNFHVAFANPVRMPDGKIEEMVFDHALFDGPVTVKAWGEVLHVRPGHLHVVNLGEAPEGYAHDYNPFEKMSTSSTTDDHARQVLAALAEEQQKNGYEFQRAVFHSTYRESGDLSGQTWISRDVLGNAEPTQDTDATLKQRISGFIQRILVSTMKSS